MAARYGLIAKLNEAVFDPLDPLVVGKCREDGFGKPVTILPIR
jgi:hypothetical protein